jgi:hypothetical protein
MARLLKLLALAAAGLLAVPGGAVAQPDFTEAPVTAPMVLAAVDICTRQVRAGAFDGGALTGAGWVLVIRGDGGGMVVRGYRHPDNMILLTTSDKPTDPDTCMVMAPTGRGMTIYQMHAALLQQIGAPPAAEDGQAVWLLDGVRLAMRAMSDVGVAIEVTPR